MSSKLAIVWRWEEYTGLQLESIGEYIVYTGEEYTGVTLKLVGECIVYEGYTVYQ